MRKLHSLALCALVTPAITLSSGALFAQQATGQDADRKQQSSQRDQTSERDQSSQRDQASQRDQGAAPSAPMTSQSSQRGQAGMQSQEYLESAPANGSQASDLIGAEVKTSGDEDVGAVQDLIIDDNGQVVAIVVSVGGFLGLGEKHVAIGWDHVNRSGTPDAQQLEIDMTRDALESAPKFERRE